jgi:GNAT superfamily N-acetyltransferase
MKRLRLLQPADATAALAVLVDAVQGQAPALYRPDQVRAWCEHAFSRADLPATFARGHGWASVTREDSAPPRPPHESLEAFALRDPPDRLSLLYCRSRSSRQGRATELLQAVETSAFTEGHRRLRTEASQFSRPLLERHGWSVEASEVVVLAGVSFERWRMIKVLMPSHADNGGGDLSVDG